MGSMVLSATFALANSAAFSGAATGVTLMFRRLVFVKNDTCERKHLAIFAPSDVAVKTSSLLRFDTWKHLLGLLGGNRPDCRQCDGFAAEVREVLGCCVAHVAFVVCTTTRTNPPPRVNTNSNNFTLSQILANQILATFDEIIREGNGLS